MIRSIHYLTLLTLLSSGPMVGMGKFTKTVSDFVENIGDLFFEEQEEETSQLDEKENIFTKDEQLLLDPNSFFSLAIIEKTWDIEKQIEDKGKNTDFSETNRLCAITPLYEELLSLTEDEDKDYHQKMFNEYKKHLAHAQRVLLEGAVQLKQEEKARGFLRTPHYIKLQKRYSLLSTHSETAQSKEYFQKCSDEVGQKIDRQMKNKITCLANACQVAGVIASIKLAEGNYGLSDNEREFELKNLNKELQNLKQKLQN